MKCKHCKKTIEGKYIRVGNDYFHPQCFTCRKCGEPIQGKFQLHKGHYYHPNCYKEVARLVCAKCGKILDDSWVEFEGRKYHPQCHRIICAICGQPIAGEYTYDNKGKYHKECFINRKAPRCDVCDRPIVGDYVKDDWGHQSHAWHGNQKTVFCQYCGRIVSASTSNGGKQYNDGRVVCGVCGLTEVSGAIKIRRSQVRVLRLLASSPADFNDIPGNVSIQLVDKRTLNRLAGWMNTPHGQGLTKSKTTYRDKQRESIEHNIYILHGLPQVEFEAVLAHEYLHVWQTERGIKLSKRETEGFCNLGSALVYQADGSKLANMLLERMADSDDSIYGKGYRKMNKLLQRYGWKNLKKRIQ